MVQQGGGGSSGAATPSALGGGGGMGQGTFGGGGSAASLISLGTTTAEGEAEEFGEMTGATSAPAGQEGCKEGGGGGGTIELSATSGEAATAAAAGGQRRVQFGGMTVIDVRGSADGGAGRGGSPRPAPVLRQEMRQPSHLEMELASGASPLISPRDGTGGYSSWLHD